MKIKKYKLTNETKLVDNEMPKSLDIEEVVLGAMLIDNSDLNVAIEIFSNDNIFYSQKHQIIYDIILDLFRKSEKIDILTVTNELRKIGKLENIGGAYAISKLTNRVASTANLESHCRILQQLYIKRKAIELSEKIINDSYDNSKDIFDTLDDCYSNLDKLSDNIFVKKVKNFNDNLNELFKRKENKEQGVTSAIKKLNNKLNGYQKSNLITIAARPSMGKSAFMTCEALHQALSHIPVGIFSLEMSAVELTARMVADYTSIESNKISLNALTHAEWQQIEAKRKEIEDLPIFINDNPSLSPLEMKIQAKKWVRENKVQVIYIDYLQLIQCREKGMNRENEIGLVSRSLKALAKELKIPIIALAQLSRQVEQRTDKIPQLSDLRDSGSIEQDSDIVMFLYRPEYYGIEYWNDNTPTVGEAEILISKFRNGNVGKCRVNADLRFMRFSGKEENFEKVNIF